MLGRKQRKLDNLIAADMRPPTTVNQVYHEPSVAWEWLSIGLLAIVGVVTLWLCVTFLFSRLGSGNPESDAAWWLMALPLFCVVVYVISWFIRSAILPAYDSYLDYKRDVARIMHQAQLTAPAPFATGRANEENIRFARLILAVMQRAYAHYEQNGRFKKSWRPWSRRSVLSVDLGDGKRTTERIADQVREWLESHEVIRGDQINIFRFKNLASVQDLLAKEFDKPIVVSGERNAKNQVLGT